MQKLKESKERSLAQAQRYIQKWKIHTKVYYEICPQFAAVPAAV